MIDQFLTDTFRKALAERSIEQLTEDLEDPRIVTVHSRGFGHWAPGDGLPGLVAEGPAHSVAIGRCATARLMKGDLGALSSTAIHPGECFFCGYPIPMLLVACDHAIWQSQLVADELAIWVFRESARYVRATGRTGEYDNPAWARWFEGSTPAAQSMSASDRAHRDRLRRDDVWRIAQYERVEVPA